MKNLPAAVILALLVSACGESPRPPTSPTPPAAPPATYTLSGVVSEMTAAGLVPVEGVRVVEAVTRLEATTDRAGFFSISGLRTADAFLSATKGGYHAYSGTVYVRADTRLDIQISPTVTYTLSGVAFEVTSAGQTPLEGVEVYCDGCGSPDGHTFAYTDKDGFYSFSWALNGATPLLVRKAGYDVLHGDGSFPGRVTATVNGDTRFDLQLVRR